MPPPSGRDHSAVPTACPSLDVEGVESVAQWAPLGRARAEVLRRRVGLSGPVWPGPLLVPRVVWVLLPEPAGRAMPDALLAPPPVSRARFEWSV